MIKNFILLGLLTWVSFSWAKHPVVSESLSDAESYKVEAPVEEQDAQRSVAGEKIKKKKTSSVSSEGQGSPATDSDSDVRYWQYSE